MNLNTLAERIYNIDPYGATDADETPETIAEKLESVTECHAAIDYLLQIIEELTA